MDTGVTWDTGKSVWNRCLCQYKLVRQVITHYHPDHIGLALAGRIIAYALAVLIGYIILVLAPRGKTIFSLPGRHSLLIYLVHIFVLPMEFHLISDIQFVAGKEMNSAVILLILAVSSSIICCIISIFYRFVILNIVNSVKKKKIS